MTQQLNLVVCYQQGPVEDYLIEEIQAVWPEVGITNVGQKDIAKALEEADYFCGHAKVPVNWDKIVGQGRLRWIQSSAAGMDWCLVPSVIASNICITTASGALSDQVAEHTLALLLAWKRNLPSFFADQFVPDGLNFRVQAGQTPNPSSNYRKFVRLPTRDLTGSSVGIVGFGGVGRRLAQLLAPFKTRIRAVDLFPENKPAYIEELWGTERLEELLGISDILILSLPLNSTTRGMFDSRRFSQMKPGTLFVNVARGPLVVTDDLINALKSGQLGGSVIDVSNPEPLPEQHPLWDAPHLLITPHVAGQAAWRFEMINRLFLENVRRLKSGGEELLLNRLSAEGKRLGFPLRNGETPLWIDWVEQG
ncbi:MAG: NAD(P)-dependent oxidoreductase [Thermoguttaceae bacterium]